MGCCGVLIAFVKQPNLHGDFEGAKEKSSAWYFNPGYGLPDLQQASGATLGTALRLK